MFCLLLTKLEGKKKKYLSTVCLSSVRLSWSGYGIGSVLLIKGIWSDIAQLVNFLSCCYCLLSTANQRDNALGSINPSVCLFIFFLSTLYHMAEPLIGLLIMSRLQHHWLLVVCLPTREAVNIRSQLADCSFKSRIHSVSPLCLCPPFLPSGAGQRGRSPRPLAKDALPNRVKCPRWGTFYGESAPGGPNFTVKVPQVGQILRWKCPRWGRFCGESAPQHRCRTRYLPQIFFRPAPWKFLHPPLPLHLSLRLPPLSLETTTPLNARWVFAEQGSSQYRESTCRLQLQVKHSLRLVHRLHYATHDTRVTH